MTEEVKEVQTEEPQKENKADNQPQKRTRMSNSQFFARDILGDSTRERLVRSVTFKSRTGKALYELIHDRIDTYMHRPKELSTLAIARDTNEQLQKIINNRLTELENYVKKRHKRIKNLYDAATAIEKFESDSSSDLEVVAGFSTSFANRYLSILTMIDDTCYMAGYLEKTGQIDMQQESNLTSELYRKNVQISRGLMVFIGRAVIGIRRQLREQRKAS